ncbi:Protein NRT1/ PTR FAMILY 4.3, partial [Striga hermonthica]
IWTSFALAGGFISITALTFSGFTYIPRFGFILLSVQAHLPQLKPPACNMLTDGDQCKEADGVKAFIFFVALYLVALGSGCVKPNMIAHGADQFNQDQPKESKKLSRYFNAAYFAFSTGELIALTVLVYVQTHSGMDIGFGVSAAAMAMGLISLICGTLLYRNKPPRGSILTPLVQVVVAAIAKRNQVCPSDPRMLNGYNTDETTSELQLTHRFRILNKACIKTAVESPWTLCTMAQVEQVKILILIMPIFACTIVFNTILAQLQTFSVQQGSSMDTRVTKSFHIPPASLQAIPYLMLIFIVPLYDTFFVPFARRITGHDSGLPPLHRIGAGLILATFSMVSAALMENKRRQAAVRSNETISIFWITPQFLIFGVSEMFTAVGLIEFFYKQSLRGMQAFLTAITYCSYSFGFYLSSVLVSVVNRVTGSSSQKGWLSDNNLNKDRLDLFYWMLAILSFANFVNYIFWARWYLRNRSQSNTTDGTKVRGDENI